MKKKTTLDIIGQSDKTSLYSISFEMDGTTEFEKFVAEFEMNSIYNGDYQRIIAALQAILRLGALERFFRPEGKMNDNVAAIPYWRRQTAALLSTDFRTDRHTGQWWRKNDQDIRNRPKTVWVCIGLAKIRDDSKQESERRTDKYRGEGADRNQRFLF